MAKTISSYSFNRELHEIKLRARQNVIQPHEERMKPKYFNGYLLQKDAGGYFILKSQPNSPTMIREDLSQSVGFAAALQKDEL
jgi:hypothetical protein